MKEIKKDEFILKDLLPYNYRKIIMHSLFMNDKFNEFSNFLDTSRKMHDL